MRQEFFAGIWRWGNFKPF